MPEFLRDDLYIHLLYCVTVSVSHCCYYQLLVYLYLAVYVYQGNPFHRNNLPVNTLILNKERDGIPMHTESKT